MHYLKFCGGCLRKQRINGTNKFTCPITQITKGMEYILANTEANNCSFYLEKGV